MFNDSHHVMYELRIYELPPNASLLLYLRPEETGTTPHDYRSTAFASNITLIRSHDAHLTLYHTGINQNLDPLYQQSTRAEFNTNLLWAFPISNHRWSSVAYFEDCHPIKFPWRDGMISNVHEDSA